jgi:hypothetical protein
MAKLKKAPGRFIGRWKDEAIAANPGASDEDLARIVNDMARKQGYDYTITPEKVRSKKNKHKGRKPAHRPAPAVAAAAPSNSAPAKATARDGITLADIRAVKEVVDRIGADRVQELAGMFSK